MTSGVAISGLEVAYGDVIALTGVDVDVPAGTSLVVIGPNGSGKSTLLGTLAGTIVPSSGTVKIGGGRPALVPQVTEVDDSLPVTVRDVVGLARYAHLGLLRRFRPADRAAVDDAMRRVEVDDLASRQLNELSGGQRQRVLLAQGLAQSGDVLLLDEPLTGLDVASSAIVLDVIDEELAAGRTVVMSTHDLADARRADQVLLLHTSQVAVGTPDEVLTRDHLRSAFGRQFIRVGNDLILDDPHHDH